MADKLGSGHVITDEDVDTARLIIDLDKALGRPTDPLTRQIADTPPARLGSVLGEPPAQEAARGANGHQLPSAAALARKLTSVEIAAELAHDVGEQLPAGMDSAEQARVVSRVQDLIRRRMITLVTGADPGH